MLYLEIEKGFICTMNKIWKISMDVGESINQWYDIKRRIIMYFYFFTLANVMAYLILDKILYLKKILIMHTNKTIKMLCPTIQNWLFFLQKNYRREIYLQYFSDLLRPLWTNDTPKIHFLPFYRCLCNPPFIYQPGRFNKIWAFIIDIYIRASL